MSTYIYNLQVISIIAPWNGHVFKKEKLSLKIDYL